MESHMQPHQELIDRKWRERAYRISIRMVQAQLHTTWGTDELNDSFEQCNVSETTICQIEGLTLGGIVETFEPPTGLNAVVNLVGTRFSFELQVGNQSRGRDGLFDYGCFRFEGRGQQVRGADGFLRVSQDQFAQLIKHLPICLQALGNYGFQWSLTASALSDPRWPEIVDDYKIWRFWCKHIQFWFDASLPSNS
jgi:hypothetical protein